MAVIETIPNNKTIKTTEKYFFDLPVNLENESNIVQGDQGINQK